MIPIGSQDRCRRRPIRKVTSQDSRPAPSPLAVDRAPRGRGVDPDDGLGHPDPCSSGAAQQAGVQNVYPHRFRHTFADNWLGAGGIG